MAIAANVPMPKVYLIDDTAPNAFATGRDPKHASVAITTGLLEKLDREELQGVIAHELSPRPQLRHPLLADRRGAWSAPSRSSPTSSCASRSGAAPARRRDRDSGGGGGAQTVIFIIAIALAILAPLISRLHPARGQPPARVPGRRLGHRADPQPVRPGAGAGQDRGDQEVLEVANRGTQHMYFTNPIKKFEERSSRPDVDPPADHRSDQPAAAADRRPAAGRRRTRPHWPGWSRGMTTVAGASVRWRAPKGRGILRSADGQPTRLAIGPR